MKATEPRRPKAGEIQSKHHHTGMPSDIFQAAMAYLKRGLNPLPLEAPTCGERRTGKKPVINGWPKHKATEEDIRMWFGSNSRYNVGLLCGSHGGIVVLDVDVPDVHTSWVRANPGAADTYTVRRDNAPPGRCHCYFLLERGQQAPKSRRFDWGELMSEGKQVVAPPSIHYTGGIYRVVNDGPLQLWRDEYIPDQGENVTEIAEITESHCSIVSAVSAVSVTLSVAEVIEQTLPKRAGERNARILDLARGLKFNAGMGEKPVADMKPHVRQWHEDALAVIRTKEFDQTWTDFVHAWEKARLPLGDAIGPAWASAMENVQGGDFTDYDSLPVRRLAALCKELSMLHPENVFFLSSHIAGKLLSVRPMQAHRWLKMMVADKLIETVRVGNAHQATRFSWIGSTET